MSEKKKTIISAAAILVTLVCSSLWCYMGVGKLKKSQATVNQKSAELASVREKIAAIPNLRQERQQLQTELTEYEDILPNDRELNKMFDTLSDFEKQSGLVIKEFKPEREARDNGQAPANSYKQVSYKLQLAGSYFQLVKFVNLLENYQRFVRVDAFDISRKPDAKVNGASLQISTFVYDPKSKAAATPKRTTATTGKPKGKAAPVVQVIPFDLAQERMVQFVYDPNETRRDPFSSPLTRRGDKIERGLAQGNQPELSPAEEQQAVADIQKAVAEANRMVDSGDFDGATKLYLDVEKSLAREFTDPLVASQIFQIRRNAQHLGIMLKNSRGEKVYEMARSLCERMQKSFEARDYDGALKLKTSVETLLKNAGNVEHEGLPELIQQAQALASRVAACKEFSTIELRVQGTFWTPDGRAAAIINNQSVVEGDLLRLSDAKNRGPVDPDKQIYVLKIRREKITFRYRGELIDKIQVE